jgi:hypothetical protein
MGVPPLLKKPSCFKEGFFAFTKLSGKHNTYIVIGIVRVPVIHVHTLSISVTNVDKVTIRRLLSLLFSLFSLRRDKSSFSVYYLIVKLHQKRASSFVNLLPATLLIVRANQKSELW